MGLALWGLLSVAFAQDESVDIELFRPSSDGFSYMAVPSAETLGVLQYSASLWAHYANDPVVLVFDGERVSPTNDPAAEDTDGVINERLSGNLQVGLGLTRFASLAIDLPVVMAQDGVSLSNLDGNAALQPLNSSGLGDLRIVPKAQLLSRANSPVAVAVAVPIGAPTAGEDAAFLGEGVLTATPTVIVEAADGSVRNRDYIFRGAVTGGYHIREAATIRDAELGSVAVFGAAIGYRVVDPVELTLEARGNVGGAAAQNPVEAMIGVKVLPGDALALNLGVGAGVLDGVGAPDYRAAFGITFAAPLSRRDFDGDGVTDDVDGCLFDREDDDDFRDEDGCPDDDNDEDGLADDVDECPKRAETPNGYQDDDGCPDREIDDDADSDGILDEFDQCPYDGEDFDTFQDGDGCPDDDNDQDGVPDEFDQCDMDPEIFNGVKDDDGCPDEGRVVVEQANIKILDRIYFDTGKASIQARSQLLLDEIAATLRGYPELRRVRVEGHTDDTGDARRNLRLSQARADAVVSALIDRGVEPGRLEAIGYGEQRPVDSNRTDEGRQNNRRVEFVILDRE
ncbi:MAG: OmpA family protein [Myxococcota bacterium]